MKLTREWTGAQALAKRQALGLNQSAFWGRVMTTQSGGSRYEGGRSIPKATQALLCIAYGTAIQAKDQFQALRGVE